MINSLTIPIFTVNNLKSGYFYLSSVLTNLNHLKNLEFRGIYKEGENILPSKALKSISKGFANFKKNDGQLISLAYKNFTKADS